MAFISVDKGNQFMDFFFILKRDRCIMIQRIVFSILSKERILDKQANQDISFKNLFQLCGVTIFGLFQERLSQIECAILIVSSDIHNFSNGQLENGDVSLAHVSFSLKSGYFELNLVYLFTDIFSGKFAILDFQTIELEQNIGWKGLFFITIDELEQILAFLPILFLNCLLKQQQIGFDSDGPVKQRDEIEYILLNFNIVS